MSSSKRGRRWFLKSCISLPLLGGSLKALAKAKETAMNLNRIQNTSQAERLGFSTSGLDRIVDVFTRMLELNEHPGAQLSIYRAGEPVLSLSGGRTGESGDAVTHDTLYQIRSTTKALTSMVMMGAYERGHFSYEDKVTDHWPEFGKNGKQDITIAQVMSHQAGIPQEPQVPASKMNDIEFVRQAVAELTPQWQPGKQNGYHPSNIGWICDVLLWGWEKRRVSTVLREEILGPAGANEMYLGLPEAAYPRMAKMVVEPNVRASAPARARFSDFINTPAGSSLPLSWVGGIGNSDSLARTMCILALNGEYNGHRFFDPETIARVSTAQTPPDRIDLGLRVQIRWGLGFILGDSGVNIYGQTPRPRALGHAGGGASYAWADPVSGLAVAFLCNRMRGAESWDRYRRIGDAVYGAMS